MHTHDLKTGAVLRTSIALMLALAAFVNGPGLIASGRATAPSRSVPRGESLRLGCSWCARISPSRYSLTRYCVPFFSPMS